MIRREREALLVVNQYVQQSWRRRLGDDVLVGSNANGEAAELYILVAGKGALPSHGVQAGVRLTDYYQPAAQQLCSNWKPPSNAARNRISNTEEEVAE